MTRDEQIAAERLAWAIEQAEQAQGEELARAVAAVAYWREKLIQACAAAPVEA